VEFKFRRKEEKNEMQNNFIPSILLSQFVFLSADDVSAVVVIVEQWLEALKGWWWWEDETETLSSPSIQRQVLSRGSGETFSLRLLGSLGFASTQQIGGNYSRILIGRRFSLS
jgi:hypothetical protein